MALWIVGVYGLTLASFLPPLLLAGYLWVHGRVPLAATFVRFETTYLGFLVALFAAYLALSAAPHGVWAVEVFFNTLFFVFYGLLFWFLSRLLAETIQRPWRGAWRWAATGFVVAGLALSLGVHALVFEGVDRALVLRGALNGVYLVAFLLGTAVMVGVSLSTRRRLNDGWKRTTLAGLGWFYGLSIPFFVVDALWPIFQDPGPIPRGLNVQVVPVIAWNLWFTQRWFVFPVRDDPRGGEAVSPLLDTLTVREREIALLILAGRTNQEICDALGVRMGTTKNHIYNIFNKTGASSRRELSQMLVTP